MIACSDGERKPSAAKRLILDYNLGFGLAQ
jgi:hypothetical protein